MKYAQEILKKLVVKFEYNFIFNGKTVKMDNEDFFAEEVFISPLDPYFTENTFQKILDSAMFSKDEMFELEHMNDEKLVELISPLTK